MSRLSSMVRSSPASRFCAEWSSTGTFTRPKLIAPFQSPRATTFLVVQALEQGREIIGVLFLLRQDLLHQAPGGRVLLAEVGDHLAVAVDGDALGDQVFPDHLLERATLDILGVAA